MPEGEDCETQRQGDEATSTVPTYKKNHKGPAQPNLKLETWNIQNPPAGESDEEVKTLSDEASSQLTLKLQKVIAKKNQVPPKQKSSSESPHSTVLPTTHFEASCARGICKRSGSSGTKKAMHFAKGPAAGTARIA